MHTQTHSISTHLAHGFIFILRLFVAGDTTLLKIALIFSFSCYKCFTVSWHYTVCMVIFVTMSDDTYTKWAWFRSQLAKGFDPTKVLKIGKKKKNWSGIKDNWLIILTGLLHCIPKLFNSCSPTIELSKMTWVIKKELAIRPIIMVFMNLFKLLLALNGRQYCVRHLTWHNQ